MSEHNKANSNSWESQQPPNTVEYQDDWVAGRVSKGTRVYLAFSTYLKMPVEEKLEILRLILHDLGLALPKEKQYGFKRTVVEQLLRQGKRHSNLSFGTAMATSLCYTVMNTIAFFVCLASGGSSMFTVLSGGVFGVNAIASLRQLAHIYKTSLDSTQQYLTTVTPSASDQKGDKSS